MKTKKFLACLLAGTMALSLVACGGNADTDANATTDSSAPVAESTTPEGTTPAAPTTVEASIDFEDGNMGFVAPYMVPANAAEVELSVVDFNGSKALAVKNLTGKVPFIGIDATSLLGADVAKVATVEMTLGVSYEDGSFNAVSGDIFAWSGADLVETKDAWSVYLATANPKTAVATLSAGEEFVADAGNIFIVSLSTDNGAGAGKGNATLYIDNIRFLDASGNLLAADSSVAFAAPKGFENTGKDMSNLCAVTGAVEWEGFQTSAGAWTQAGVAFTDEVKAALVPGSVIEIEYSSETGNMWLVMNEAAVGWTRVGVGNIDGSGTTSSACNNGICQVTYEQIASMCGDDISTWGSGLQCESDGAWEVYSVKVGQAAPVYALSSAVEWEGFTASAGAWTQAGVAFTDEVKAALVPGSVIEVTYSSETGNMWLVMNEAAVGWTRVGVGNIDGSGTTSSACNNGICQVTYEQIASMCGDDISTWGSGLQCESDGAWEVFSVTVGQTPVAE